MRMSERIDLIKKKKTWEREGKLKFLRTGSKAENLRG